MDFLSVTESFTYFCCNCCLSVSTVNSLYILDTIFATTEHHHIIILCANFYIPFLVFHHKMAHSATSLTKCSVYFISFLTLKFTVVTCKLLYFYVMVMWLPLCAKQYSVRWIQTYQRSKIGSHCATWSSIYFISYWAYIKIIVLWPLNICLLIWNNLSVGM